MDEKADSSGKESTTKDNLLRRSFGDAMRKFRKRLFGGSQAALARKAGLADSIVGAIERGERSIDLKEIATICAAIGVDFEEFLEEVQQNQISLVAIDKQLRQEIEVQERPVRGELKAAADLVFEKMKVMFLNMAEPGFPDPEERSKRRNRKTPRPPTERDQE